MAVCTCASKAQPAASGRQLSGTTCKVAVWLLGGFNYVDVASVAAFSSEDNLTGFLGKQCVVVAHTDVKTGEEPSPSLAHYDVSGDYILSARALYAKTTARAVASVGCASLSFFMCHKLALFYRIYLYFCNMLPVTGFFTAVFAP